MRFQSRTLSGASADRLAASRRGAVLKAIGRKSWGAALACTKLVSSGPLVLDRWPARHSNASPLRADSIWGLQQTCGNARVRRRIEAAGGRAAVRREPSGGSPAVRRKIMIAGPTTLYGTRLSSGWNQMAAGLVAKFLAKHRAKHFKRRKHYRSIFALARNIVNDMAASSDELKFSDEAELLRAVMKRLNMAYQMRISQGIPVRSGGKKAWTSAFGYPNRGAARSCGPRVNDAARSYWTGPHRGSPPCLRGQYCFQLSSAGKKNAYNALQTLFTIQGKACKRTLIHCDYLISVMHFKAFAESIGASRFNELVDRGRIPMILTNYGFMSISRGGAATSHSLRRVVLSRRSDLIIGDHVILHNHPAYDLIKGRSVWRLENAILVNRRGSVDLFQGHGYKRPVTETSMRKDMRRHFKKALWKVRRLIRDTRIPAKRAAAQAGLAARNVKMVAGRYRIKGTAFYNIAVDHPVKLPKLGEFPGLNDPRFPAGGVLYPVWRPVESE